MPLYHSAPILLEPGSIVIPGNYGRILRLLDQNHPRFVNEMILEAVRFQHFPDKPSRLMSSFACVTIETARFYANVVGRRADQVIALWPVIYEVEKTQIDAIEHHTDFNLIAPVARRPENMAEIAARYWQASLWMTIAEYPGLRCEEVVTPSALRIIRRVE